jgi:hypothetical protein
MAVSIIDENTPHDSIEYLPFDDSRSGSVKKAASESHIVNLRPIDTTAIDHLRQGIEVTTYAHQFKGAFNLWAGNIKGFVRIHTLGQPVSFTEEENSKIWKEDDIFDPINFIVLGQNYPLPIILNDAPQQGVEALLRPFVISFMTNGAEAEVAHTSRGSVEDGNQDLRVLAGKTSQIRQFIDFRNQNDFIPFLDTGQLYYGQSGNITGSIISPGHLNDGEMTYAPYDDLGPQKIINKLPSVSDALRAVLYTSPSVDLDEDIRTYHDIKSAPAGWDVYGPGQGQYGTDSLAYIGYFRGA